MLGAKSRIRCVGGNTLPPLSLLILTSRRCKCCTMVFPRGVSYVCRESKNKRRSPTITFQRVYHYSKDLSPLQQGLSRSAVDLRQSNSESAVTWRPHDRATIFENALDICMRNLVSSCQSASAVRTNEGGHLSPFKRVYRLFNRVWSVLYLQLLPR